MDAPALARRLAAVAVLALGMTAAGCGSSDPSSRPQPAAAGQPAAEPVKWAGTFCAGLGEVIRSAAAMGSAPSDARAHKQSLLAFADSLQQSLDGTAAKLERLGAPTVPRGAETQQIVLDFFTAASEATASQREKLVALDPAASDFDERLGEIVSSGATSQLSGRMSEVTGKPELAPAFRDAPECQQMAAEPR